MAKQLFLNNFESTFIANVKDAPTTGTPATELGYGILQLNSGAAAALVNPTGGDHYIITAYKRSGSVESNIEIMHVLEVDNTTINECRIRVSRGQEGTPAQAYVPGDYVALRFTKGGAENFLQDGDSRLSGVYEPAFSAGTTSQYFRGDKTWRDFLVDVRAATLTGLSTATNAVITAADTILSALGKLQKQVTDLDSAKYAKTGGSISGDVSVTGELTVGTTINKSPVHRAAATNLTGTTLDFTAGTDFYKTISANTTITLSNASGATGLAQAASLIINHTGGTITFAGATLKWLGGVTPTFTSGRVHQIYFWPDPITNQVLASAASFY